VSIRVCLARQYREAAQARGEARAILDATDEAMVMVGPSGQIRSMNRRLGELFGMSLDELRTPLTSIKGFADLLLDEPDELGREQREFIDIIKANADRLVALINDLLDISRIESGKVELRPTAVDLGRILQAVARSLQPQLEQKEQRLTVEVAFDVAAVWADADRLTQIFTNLLSNAHKYTPRGGSIAVLIGKVVQRDEPQLDRSAQDRPGQGLEQGG
ncbi:MAG TPA: histidine kinase dimerization/phospho-acceptor domain-containing protein, partial [Chloroflexota bacterium]